jgi:hypothetical protein
MATAGEPLHPHQRVGTPAPLLKRLKKKKGNWHQNKNPARGNIFSIALSGEHCWSSKRKNSKPQLQGHKELKP